MFEEKGILPIGVLHAGTMHTGYTLRPMKVKDTLTARRSPDFARCEGDDELMGLLSYAARLQITGVPAEAMTLDLMLELYDEDLDELMAADGRLKEQIARFRGQCAKTDGSGAGTHRDALGVGPDNWPEGGTGMDRSLAGSESAAEEENV